MCTPAFVTAGGGDRVTHAELDDRSARLAALPHGAGLRPGVAVHGAAPCPPETTRSTLGWCGPIVHEYYGASEGFGRTTIDPAEWLERPGSVGRPAGSRVAVVDETGCRLAHGEVGQVCPREFEDVLVPPSEVADVGVLGLPDPDLGERVTAVVVPAPGAGADGLADRLVAHCRERLAGFTIPRDVRVVDTLPRSDAGKIRVAALRAALVPQPAGDMSWS